MIATNRRTSSADDTLIGNSMAKKFGSDADLKKKATLFFQAARESIGGVPDKNSKNGFRFLKGIVFTITGEVQAADNALVSKCINLVGSKYGNEKEISAVAWERVWQSLAGQEKTEDVTEIVKQFIADLSNHSKSKFTFVTGNHVIRLENPIDEIKIGPVTAIRSESYFRDVYDSFKDPKWNYEIGSEFEFRYDNNSVVIEMPSVCWTVDVAASRANVEEEAIWMINIAISLLRLSFPIDQHFLFPHWNDVEDDPISKTSGESAGITFSGHGMSGGGISSPMVYIVDQRVANVARGRDFQERATAVLCTYAKGSLSVRCSQGLGWLTRGRQTADRAERFLFFFTAIEALLASDDKSAPVIQTIARYASVLLTDEPSRRSKMAKRIKKLYAKRSALVHTGQRSVSWTDLIEAQILADSIYRRVLEECDMHMKFQAFQASLSEASYGSRWLGRGKE